MQVYTLKSHLNIAYKVRKDYTGRMLNNSSDSSTSSISQEQKGHFFEKLQQWILENKGLMAGVIALIACLCFLFMQCVFWEDNKVRHGLLEKQVIEQLQVGQQSALAQLGGRYEKQPALYKAVDPTLLECCIQNQDITAAQKVAQRMFLGAPQSIEAYVQFSKTSLVIQAEEYAIALEQTLALRQALEAADTIDSHLFRFCSLRAGWLHKKLGEAEKSQQVLGAFSETEDKSAEFVDFKSSVSYLGSSLMEFLTEN